MIVVMSTVYPNDPLENSEVQHLSQGGMAFDHLRWLKLKMRE